MNPERADSTLAFRLDSSRIPCYRGRRRCPAPEDISARPANNVTVPTSGGPPLLGRTLAVAVALAVALAVGLAADTHPPKQSSSGMVARVMRRRHDSSRFHPRKLGCITLAGHDDEVVPCSPLLSLVPRPGGALAPPAALLIFMASGWPGKGHGPLR
jgi:hypothetical protein